MRLKTSTDACKEALIRGGYYGDWLVRIAKGTVVGYKTSTFVGWNYSQDIILILV